MELVIARTPKSDSVEIVARIGDFMGTYYIDIREFNLGTFKGPSKRGVRIPLAQAGEFIKTITDRLASEEFLIQLQTIIRQEAL